MWEGADTPWTGLQELLDLDDGAVEVKILPLAPVVLVKGVQLVLNLPLLFEDEDEDPYDEHKHCQHRDHGDEEAFGGCWLGLQNRFPIATDGVERLADVLHQPLHRTGKKFWRR